jgi:hypothetical protein
MTGDAFIAIFAGIPPETIKNVKLIFLLPKTIRTEHLL